MWAQPEKPIRKCGHTRRSLEVWAHTKRTLEESKQNIKSKIDFLLDFLPRRDFRQIPPPKKERWKSGSHFSSFSISSLSLDLSRVRCDVTVLVGSSVRLSNIHISMSVGEGMGVGEGSSLDVPGVGHLRSFFVKYKIFQNYKFQFVSIHFNSFEKKNNFN